MPMILASTSTRAGTLRKRMPMRATRLTSALDMRAWNHRLKKLPTMMRPITRTMIPTMPAIMVKFMFSIPLCLDFLELEAAARHRYDLDRGAPVHELARRLGLVQLVADPD